MSAVEDIKAASSELLTAPPAKALLRFALPLMAGGACQQIYALTDAAVVGRVLGVNALSALGACDLLVWLVGASLGAVLGTDCVLYAETLAWIAGAVITTIGAVYYARRLKTPSM